MHFLRILLVLLCVGSLRADYLFTYFTRNGEDGLHLAWSKDGVTWEKLNGGRSYLAPKVGKSKLMRDPCVVRGPDGTFHMVWTSGWWENNIGYASTKDFITWSEQREIPVMAHEPTARNCWAPEIVYDAKRAEFLIFWATTISGRFAETAGASEDQLNHRMYYTTTRDFRTFSPTKLFYDPGFSVIDATFVSPMAGTISSSRMKRATLRRNSCKSPRATTSAGPSRISPRRSRLRDFGSRDQRRSRSTARCLSTSTLIKRSTTGPCARGI